MPTRLKVHSDADVVPVELYGIQCDVHTLSSSIRFVFTLYEVKIVPLPELIETYTEVYKLTYPHASILYHRLHTVKLLMASGLLKCIICLQVFQTQHSFSLFTVQ